MKKFVSGFITALLMVIMTLNCTVSLAAPASTGISALKIATGKTAIEQLEGEGYIVIYQDLNFAPGAETKIYLGYKMGNDPITGLVVSGGYSTSLSYDGAVYAPVSDANLNAKTAGTPVYLYYTKDKSAGSGIAALTAFSRNPKNDSDIPDFYGDGSVPVRTTNGKAADFEAGIADYDLFLFMIRSSLCLPYISEIKTVDIAGGERAFEKLAATGCDYYVETPVGKSGGASTYICYNRTADASEAVRYIALSDPALTADAKFTLAGSGIFGGTKSNLFYTKSQEIGNPVTDITVGAVMSESFTLGEWAASYFGGRSTAAASRLFKEDAYDALIRSDEAYTQIPVGIYSGGIKISDSDIYTVLSAKNLVLEISVPTEPADSAIDEEPDITEEDTAEAPDTEDTMDGTEYYADGEMHDSQDSDTFDSGYESFDTANGTSEEVSPGTAIGSGSLIAIAVMLIVAVTLCFIFVTVSNGKKSDFDGEEPKK